MPKPARRFGFAISPRIAIPVLLVMVLAMFVIFTTYGSGGVPAAKIAVTMVVSAAILVVFAVLAVVSRSERARGRASGIRPEALRAP